MLVLSRRTWQDIRIGDDITVTVVEIQDDCVRIGIKAPRSVPVHREDVYDQIKEREKKGGAGEKRLELGPH